MVRKKLSSAQVERLRSLRPDVTLDEIKKLFAAFGPEGPEIDFTAEFQLDMPSLPKEKEAISLYWSLGGSEETRPVITTAGRYLANLILFGVSMEVRKQVPYINKPFDKGVIGGIDDFMARLLVEDKINEQDYIKYVDRMNWLGFGTTPFVAPSLDLKTIIPKPKASKLKKELIEKNREKLEAGDVATVNKVTDEILAQARKELEEEDASGLVIYNSGASGSYGNNYKATSVMRGLIPRSDKPGEFTFSETNLTDGIGKDETHTYADMIVTASFSRSVGTQLGGYEAKKLNAAFQAVVLGKEGSDCKSPRTLKVKLTDKNKGDYHLRYIVVRNNLVLLDADELEDRVGTTVQMRSPMYCTSPNICSKCAGELYYKMGVKNMGLLMSRVGTKILNLSLKKFHDLTVKTARIKLSDHIKEI